MMTQREADLATDGGFWDGGGGTHNANIKICTLSGKMYPCLYMAFPGYKIMLYQAALKCSSAPMEKLI